MPDSQERHENHEEIEALNSRYSALLANLGLDPNEEIDQTDPKFIAKARHSGSKESVLFHLHVVRELIENENYAEADAELEKWEALSISDPTNPDNPKIAELVSQMFNLTFMQLMSIRYCANQIAETSFRECPDGFENAKWEKLRIEEGEEGTDGVYRLHVKVQRSIPFDRFITNHPGILQTGSTDKEEMMKAVREMILQLGNRILETE
ncbi:MAG: hypothetical protein WC651_01625 [Candidatus Gracilibacteria bacterium]|jgi:hypothetical protein